MTSLRSIAIALSLVVHASFGYAMLPANDTSPIDALSAGNGDDAIFVEQGVALEGLVKLGDEIQTIETADVTPVAKETPPPVQEVKAVDELRDTITSQASKVEDNIVKTQEPPPVTPPPPKPEVVQAAEEQPQQVAMASQQSSGEAKQGSKNLAAQAMYRGELFNAIQKAKISPGWKHTGTVKVTFKVGLRGELLSREIVESSGSNVLDKAVLAALDRTEFPPMPNDVGQQPMDFTIPFKFVTR